MLSLTAMEDRLNNIQDRIQKAATNAGRKYKNITLVAITKSFPVKLWEQVLNINITTLGESRIQETEKKSKAFHKRDKIELHLIGHLQSNKARKAVELFDVIQTIDSIKLAEKIDKICGIINKKQNIYLQIKIEKDPRKHGISVKKLPAAAREITKMKNINLIGIMTIPSNRLAQSELGLVYRKTKEVQDKICKSINEKCKNISMGMSNDYETAILEGATHIRIGTGLFGPRTY